MDSCKSANILHLQLLVCCLILLIKVQKRQPGYTVIARSLTTSFHVMGEVAVFCCSWADNSMMCACKDWTMAASTAGSYDNIPDSSLRLPQNSFCRSCSTALHIFLVHLISGRKLSVTASPSVVWSTSLLCGRPTSPGCGSWEHDTWLTLSPWAPWQTHGAGSYFSLPRL